MQLNYFYERTTTQRQLQDLEIYIFYWKIQRKILRKYSDEK